MAHVCTRYLCLLLVIRLASAWTLVWRNDTNAGEVVDGQSEQACTQIWHEAGEEFSFDPEGPWCLKFYRDATCEHSNGITCEGYMWKQRASQNLSAFNVYSMPPDSRTSFGFASATPTSSSTVAEATPTESSAEELAVTESAESDSGLSGGAIAGIAVGLFVVVVFLCAAFFYLGRRTGRKAATASASALPQTSSPAGPDTNTDSAIRPSPPPSSTPTVYAPPQLAELPKPAFETEYTPPPVTYIQPPNGLRMVELPGQNGGHELSNTRQLQELEGQGVRNEKSGF
ncbi:hypothetical protein BJX99DRAFT_146254 [Aspergillus californicus]